MKIDVAYIPLKYYDFEYLIYTDVDLVWLQPRLVDYFAIMLDADDKQVDVLFASIGKGSFEICTGFYVMRRNNFSIGFLGSILSCADKLGAHDQEIANERYKSLIPQDRIKPRPYSRHQFSFAPQRTPYASSPCSRHRFMP